MTRVVKGRLLLGVALFFSILIYARTLRFDFVYDDWNQIVRNPHLESATFIPVYFKADVWSQFHTAGQGRYYRPIFLLWLFLNRTMFGLAPAGWHATSLLLELVAISLFYTVCTKLLKDPLGGGIAAVLFAVHPANLESVAWVSCSSELLMGILLLLAFLLYLRFRAGGGSVNLAVSALSFAVALGCKETSVAFLLILMWHEWCCPPGASELEKINTGSQMRTSPVVRLAPYFFVALLYFAVRTAVLGGHTLGEKHEITFAVAVMTMPSAMLFYLRDLFFPVGLSVFYDLPYAQTMFSAKVALALVVVISVAGLLWLIARRLPNGRVALGWIFLPLLPPLAGLRVFTHGDLVHDRYLYLCTMGLAMLVADLAINVTENGWDRRVRQVLPFVAAGAFLWLSIAQLGYWKNNLALYQRGIQISPRSIFALDTLANERFRHNDLAGAVNAYERSLAVDPSSWMTNMALGITLTGGHEDGQAIPYYVRAISIDPESIDPYMMLARAQERQSRYTDAEQTVVRGLAVANNMPELHFELGALLERRGDFAGARAQYERTLALNPGQRDAVSRLSALAQLKPAS